MTVARKNPFNRNKPVAEPELSSVGGLPSLTGPRGWARDSDKHRMTDSWFRCGFYGSGVVAVVHIYGSGVVCIVQVWFLRFRCRISFCSGVKVLMVQTRAVTIHRVTRVTRLQKILEEIYLPRSFAKFIVL